MATSTHTFGSDAGHAAMTAALPQSYPMDLNRSDMATLIDVLLYAWQYAPNDLDERAASLYSSIAETVGIELI